MISIPCIEFTAAERQAGRPRAYSVATGAYLLKTHGCLELRGAFEPEQVETWREAFLRRYRRYFHDRAYPDALTVGPRRFMITVRLRPPFSTPALYAHPLVLLLARATLGEDCVLGGFGAVAALPGAGSQHLHRDHAALFEGEAAATLPAFALTMIVPLIELSELHGTTRVYPGSHRLPEPEAQAASFVDPVLPPGSALLMDYRLWHGGTPNPSPRLRPILYQVYQKPWFQDRRNYKKQLALEISRRALRQVPPEHRPLFLNAAVRGWL